jgi:hypothetical protein
MKLSPEHYVCPVHHLDITDAVEEALEEEVPVSYGISYRRRESKRAFKVIVMCPGAGGDEPHPLTATGTVVQQ